MWTMRVAAAVALLWSGVGCRQNVARTKVQALSGDVTFSVRDDVNGRYAGSYSPYEYGASVQFEIFDEVYLKMWVGGVLGLEIPDEERAVSTSVDADLLASQSDPAACAQGEAYYDASLSQEKEAQRAIAEVVTNHETRDMLLAFADEKEPAPVNWKKKCAKDLAACEALCLLKPSKKAKLACMALCAKAFASCLKECKNDGGM
jgi:hypothetical protein